MSDVGTSAAAVERLAAWHDNEAAAWRADGADNGLARIHDLHAATLRALLAERDIERANAETLNAICQRAETERDAALEHARVWHQVAHEWSAGIATARAERDAARAAALEEAAQVVECGCDPEMRAAVVAVSPNSADRWEICSEACCAAIEAAAIRALAKEPQR